jgi:hypothetical protein
MKNIFEQGKNIMKTALLAGGLMVATDANAGITLEHTAKKEHQTEHVKTLDEGGHHYTARVTYEHSKPVQYDFTDVDLAKNVTIETIDQIVTASKTDTVKIDGQDVIHSFIENQTVDGKPDRMVMTMPDGKKISVYFDMTDYQIDGWDEAMNVKDNPKNILTPTKKVEFINMLCNHHKSVAEKFPELR